MACGVKVDPLTPALELGKGIHWDTNSQSLYCVDMFAGKIHSYKPECDRFTAAIPGCGDKPLAFAIPVEGKPNQFVISLKNDLACVTWDGVSCKMSEPKVIQSVEPSTNDTRINYGKVDPKGRLWVGTIGKKLSEKHTDLQFEENAANLYMLKDPCSVVKQQSCLTVASGMEWSCDRKKLFFIDSSKLQIDAYDYCDEAGKICNPCPIFKLKENNLCGFFDGMTMDCDGKLYVANYMGCQVVVIDPATCKMVNQIKIPAKEVTSCCFGGPNNDVLFVSTGSMEKNPNYPCAGRVFKVCNLGVKGIPGRAVCL